MKKRLLFLIIFFSVCLILIIGVLLSYCCCVKKRSYSIQELEEGLIRIEIVTVDESVAGLYHFETIKVFNLVEQREILEKISKITFVQMLRPVTNINPSYSILFIYSDRMLEFSLDNAICEVDLNGRRIDSDKFFPADYNAELKELIEDYL